ncbi:chorismate-binding protein [Nocardia arthritidis]|uniref:chorismate-binding protein n=1 Tax=Nocardia arthritidis TaxID=228602 RepID=UPI000A02DA81
MSRHTFSCDGGRVKTCGSTTPVDGRVTAARTPHTAQGNRSWVARRRGSTAFRARFSVAIRTAVVDRRTGASVYGSGGGITWDSRADSERRELLIKAQVLAGVPVRPDAVDTPALRTSTTRRQADGRVAAIPTRPSSRVGSVAPSLSRTCSPTSRRARGAGRRDALTHRSPPPRACRCR